MSPRTTTPSPAPTVETIMAAYLAAAEGDALLAMRRVIVDALTDLCEAERRTLRRDRLISRGYVRGTPEHDEEARDADRALGLTS